MKLGKTAICLCGCIVAIIALMPTCAPAQETAEYRHRVETVRRVAGFVALWDFVKRTDGHFAAYQAKGDHHDFTLDAMNYAQAYWDAGRPATYEDFPLLGRGPFGQAIRIRQETDDNFRPMLLVSRERLQDSGLDVKGPGKSVSVVVWLIRESGNHAIAGIWGEGTNLHDANSAVKRVERGKRQYALFAGLGANDGGVAAHISENGAGSFGDKFARNLAVTPEVIPAVPADSAPEVLDRSWSTVGFTFNNKMHTLTAYLNGKASEKWVENPEEDPFYKLVAKGWLQAQLHKTPGLQPGEDPSFPADQYYNPPENRPLSRTLVSDNAIERVEIQTFPFTRVRVTLRKHTGRSPDVVKRELIGLRVNPLWFGHDIYTPATPEMGGDFTIGRVVHTAKTVGFTGYIGGVAVFSRALTAAEMVRLAKLGKYPLEFSGQSSNSVEQADSPHTARWGSHLRIIDIQRVSAM